MKTLPRAIGAITLVGLLTLTGCGSDSDADNPSDTTAGDGAPTNGRQGLDSEQFDEIRECLSAAGLEDAFPSGMPSGRPSDAPSDLPSDQPSDFPSDPPTDMPPGGPGGGFGAFDDPEVQEALEACGIDLPQRPQGDEAQ